jgi:hypothetical protein
LHAVPLALAGLEHTPVAGLHTPAAWHWSGAAQTTGSDPAHAPAWQVSVCVQASPSSQALLRLGPVQTPAWQVSLPVQPFPSSQTGPVNKAQVPFAAAPAAIAQASQGPAPQAVSQQTPSAQKPLWQSAANVHPPPRDAEVE